jgi:hypothetical protein
MEQSREIPASTRAFFVAVALGAAALVSLITSPPGTLLWAWLFPVGLVGLFVAQTSIPIAVAVLLLGWFCYIYVCVHALSQRRLSRYAMIYTVLIGLLVLNVLGCHHQISEIKLDH